MDPSILIVSPVRNEAAHIERVVRAVAAQELPPARWFVRDDLSDDVRRTLLQRHLSRDLSAVTETAAPQ